MKTPPLKAVLLIGGRSSRMGRAKHLLGMEEQPRTLTWLEHTLAVLQPLVAEVVLSGRGELPAACDHCRRIDDLPDIGGPLAGVLAAMRSDPQADWLVLACDMPRVEPAAIRWLLQQRTAECSGVVPRQNEEGWYEPLFALYRSGAVALFEQQYREGRARMGLAARNPAILNPIIPASLRHAWRNINTPEELQRFYRETLRIGGKTAV